MTTRRAGYAVALCLLLAGCGGAPGGQHTAAPHHPVTTVHSSAPATSPAPVIADPQEITIPAINARSSLVPLGLNPDGTAEVPPLNQPQQAGWYKLGPRPGQVGPAVILGHINGNHHPGIFAHLSQLKPGDEIDVDTLKFTVTEVQDASKGAFPANRVYGTTTDPELRVITCGGSFDSASGNYRDNIIVYAHLA